MKIQLNLKADLIYVIHICHCEAEKLSNTILLRQKYDS